MFSPKIIFLFSVVAVLFAFLMWMASDGNKCSEKRSVFKRKAGQESTAGGEEDESDELSGPVVSEEKKTTKSVPLKGLRVPPPLVERIEAVAPSEGGVRRFIR